VAGKPSTRMAGKLRYEKLGDFGEKIGVQKSK
jgi:hypothetical protein